MQPARCGEINVGVYRGRKKKKKKRRKEAWARAVRVMPAKTGAGGAAALEARIQSDSHYYRGYRCHGNTFYFFSCHAVSARRLSLGSTRFGGTSDSRPPKRSRRPPTDPKGRPAPGDDFEALNSKRMSTSKRTVRRRRIAFCCRGVESHCGCCVKSIITLRVPAADYENETIQLDCVWMRGEFNYTPSH
ncbi:hypothetical protein EYF80_026292 [Liparis tanakae]|uniref:Uncharacterized protein n=1 Tax=Liparis tanakae TaxID=230148 RepID=A0A4Z2HF75_9TELE|nr:hypothetical protein EYF80_026292 [Liparis tanakae]